MLQQQALLSTAKPSELNNCPTQSKIDQFAIKIMHIVSPSILSQIPYILRFKILKIFLRKHVLSLRFQSVKQSLEKKTSRFSKNHFNPFERIIIPLLMMYLEQFRDGKIKHNSNR